LPFAGNALVSLRSWSSPCLSSSRIGSIFPVS
jgi:hypothetical protein